MTLDANDQMDTDSDEEESSKESHPLHCVVPEILTELKHLDLTGRAIFEESKLTGGGAYGDICKARCVFKGRGNVKVAIKRLRFYMKEDIIMLFEKEIYVWAKLERPNILPLLGYAFDSQTGYPLLISEWMKNGSAWIFVNSRPECDLMRLVVGITKGLAYLHKNGVVHSDIKSDNILVTDSEEAVICDFGCSRMLAASRSLANLSTGIKGTSQYLAYELLAFPNLTHSMKTDVWAFGMTVFEPLARQRSYANLLESQVLTSIMKFELPSLSSSSTLCPPETRQKLWEICQLCWTRKPEERADMDFLVTGLTASELSMDAMQCTLKSTSNVEADPSKPSVAASKKGPPEYVKRPPGCTACYKAKVKCERPNPNDLQCMRCRSRGWLCREKYSVPADPVWKEPI